MLNGMVSPNAVLMVIVFDRRSTGRVFFPAAPAPPPPAGVLFLLLFFSACSRRWSLFCCSMLPSAAADASCPRGVYG